MLQFFRQLSIKGLHTLLSEFYVFWAGVLLLSKMPSLHVKHCRRFLSSDICYQIWIANTHYNVSK
jgi:hypothetical protein